MRFLWITAMLLGSMTAGRVTAPTWPEGMTFPRYLKENNLTALLRTISAEDMQYVAEIQSGERYHELRKEGQIVQALIPLGDEMQIQIRRDRAGGYHFDIVPIATREVSDTVSFAVGEGYRKTIDRHTRYPRLGFWLSRLYSDEALFRTLRPQDRVAFLYTQKERLGRPIGPPRIKAGLIRTHGKDHFAVVDRQGKAHEGIRRAVTYTANEKRPFTYTAVHKVPDKRFRMPLDRPRITSRFSLRRWHPILKKYRPHFGVDFGARRGTPLRAVNSGKVIYAGWMRGYGKVTKIDHGGGFVSLYAHQSRILVKKGQRVRRGQTIGRVGSTGRSTGPHLHFGLYCRGKPVDPLKYIARKGTGTTRTVIKKHTVMKTYPVQKKRYVEIEGARALKMKLEKQIGTETTNNYRWPKVRTNMIRLHAIPVDQQERKRSRHG